MNPEILKAMSTAGYAAPDQKEYDSFASTYKAPVVAPVAPATQPAGLSEADVRANLAKFGYTATPSTSGLTSSSSTVRNDESRTSTGVQNLVSDSSRQEQLLKDHYDSIANQQEALRQRRIAEIDSINKSFDATKTATEKEQVKETGATSVALARIGGYLGGTASGTGAMLNLADTHRAQLGSLEAKRQAAIQTANQAITDKEFALAKEKTTEARAILKEIENSKQQFFENSIKLQQESKDRVADDLEAFSYMDPSAIPAERKAEIDEYYGVPGFADRYLRATSAIANVKADKDALAVQKDLVGLLKDIPAGQKVVFPDGTTYTGMGSAGDLVTVTATDGSGVVRQFTIDKMNQQIVGSINLGAVGKADAGAEVAPGLSAAGAALTTLADPVTGKISPQDYTEMYKIFVAENPGKGEAFIKQFNPILYTGQALDKTFNR